VINLRAIHIYQSKLLGLLHGVVNFSVLLEHVTVSLSQEHTKSQVPITSYNPM